MLLENLIYLPKNQSLAAVTHSMDPVLKLMWSCLPKTQFCTVLLSLQGWTF